MNFNPIEVCVFIRPLQITGYTQEDFYRHPNFMDTLIYADDMALWRGHVYNINGNGIAEVLQLRITSKDGQIRWIEHLCSAVMDEEGKVMGVRSANLDITERKRAELELVLAAKVFESSTPTIITDPNGIIIRCNQAICNDTGYSESEILGKTPALFRSGRHDHEFYRSMWKTIERTDEWQGEIWDRRKNGEVYPKWLVISVIRGMDGVVSHYIGTHLDMSEHKKSEDKYMHWLSMIS